MANIASQKKRILRTERERLENRRYTSAIKTYFRRLQAHALHRFGYAFKASATEFADVATSNEDRARCWILWQWGQVPLKDGDHLLGRDGDVAIWLESPTVSRHHALIRVSGPDATVEDLGSKNGTFLRGERLSAPAPLADGDEISVGSVLIRFRRIESGTVTATHVE